MKQSDTTNGHAQVCRFSTNFWNAVGYSNVGEHLEMKLSFASQKLQLAVVVFSILEMTWAVQRCTQIYATGPPLHVFATAERRSVELGCPITCKRVGLLRFGEPTSLEFTLGRFRTGICTIAG